nr:ATP-binding protein [Enhygromyxa salina]
MTGDAGSGKTAALRNLRDQRPEPEYRIVYICDSSVTPAGVYRKLAAALGLKPARQRDALWRQLKTTIEHLVDVEGVIPTLVLDEAQHLPDSLFLDLTGFLNRNFDRPELLTVWLVGLPSLAARIGMRQHAALASRVAATNVMPPRGREDFMELLEHGLKVSHGLPRQASRLLRTSLMLAHDRDQSFVDERVMLDACEELQLGRPSVTPSGAETEQPRGDRGTISRK